MSEFQTLEKEAKAELGKIDISVKLEYQKVMSILRSLLPGDHEAIREVKKLAMAGGPESLAATIKTKPDVGAIGSQILGVGMIGPELSAVNTAPTLNVLSAHSPDTLSSTASDPLASSESSTAGSSGIDTVVS